MFEMTHSCAEHCYSALVRLLHGILVADASARLHDRVFATAADYQYFLYLFV